MAKNGLSPWTFVTLDFECKKCKVVVERVIHNSKRELQDCEKCGKRMEVQFPIGNQLTYETGWKPLLDYVTSPVEKVIESKSEWRKRKKQTGYRDGYMGGGWRPQDLTGGINKGK